MSLLNPIVMAAAFDVRPDLVTPLSPESDSYKPVWGLAKTDPASVSLFANSIPYLKINSAGVVSPQNGATLSGWTSSGDVFASPMFTGTATFPDGGTWKNDGLHNTTWNAGTFAGTIAASGANLNGIGLSSPTINGGTVTGTKINSVFGFLPQIGSSTALMLYVPLVGGSLAIGNNDLYTVPAGRKALIGQAFRLYNPSAGNITAYGEIKVSGIYYQIVASATLSAGTGAVQVPPAAIVLNAGESISINCATTAGLNVRGAIAEFDAGVTQIATARILALSSGDQTLLTAPAGKSIMPIATNTSAVSTNQAIVNVVNNTGGGVNIYINAVPSGGSVGSTNQLFPATAIANNAQATFTTGTLAAGDFLSVHSDTATAGQVAWVTYYQIP